MSAFQATISGRFAHLATLVDEDADLDSMVTYFNKAVTDTIAQLLGKQRQKRKPWLTTWTQSLVIKLPKKGNLQLCQNYRTISLISHPSKVMLKIIINRLHPQAEEIIAEEQTDFRAGRSTAEQISNLRNLCEKYLQHQQNLYHVFIDFKKVFHRVWSEALWAAMRKYSINANIIRAIENLYDTAQSAVLFNGGTGEWFRTTVGVRQGCLLSPAVLNIFLERIMCDSLNDHEGSISIGGRLITNFHFADDIVVHDDLLTMVMKRKLEWYGHISRSSGMAKTILQGTVKGAKMRGRQKKRWEDNIKEWTGMGFGDSLRAAEDREGWKGIFATSSVVPRRPPRLRDWDEMTNRSCTDTHTAWQNGYCVLIEADLL